MSNVFLNVNGIEVIYNHVILVLKGVSLQVPEGSIVAILGGNGAGKTTTLRAVSNLLKGERGEVTKGTIELDGQNVAALSPNELVRRGVVQVSNTRGGGLAELAGPPLESFGGDEWEEGGERKALR